MTLNGARFRAGLFGYSALGGEENPVVLRLRIYSIALRLLRFYWSLHVTDQIAFFFPHTLSSTVSSIVAHSLNLDEEFIAACLDGHGRHRLHGEDPPH